MTPFWTDLLTALGLFLTGIGAFIAARAVILREEDALEIGVARFASSDPKENLKLPSVKNLLAASSAAQMGLWLIVCGTALQVLPVIARLLGL
jgi:hypothetical protein